MSFYIQKPTTFMREAPQEFSCVVSEALYSEEIELLEENGAWVRIRTQVDGYEGWLLKEAVVRYSNNFFDRSIVRVQRLKAHIYSVADTEFGPILSLPFESRLKVLEERDVRWIHVMLLDGREAFVQRGDVAFAWKVLSKSEMVEFSKEFLGLPYTWGGRSSFGYDCSGFVQMLYREMGVHLPRDSKDQMAWEGFASVEVEEMGRGDLVFFGREEKRVSHVGMSIGGEEFIHATVREQKPWVHISRLSDPEWNGSGPLAFRAARGVKAGPTCKTDCRGVAQGDSSVC